MNIENPLFWIPEKNKREESKRGGGDKPKYHGDKTKFEEHKRKRVHELDTLFESTQKPSPSLSLPDGQLYFELGFHENALAKSAQPREFLTSYNIDVYAQKTETKFLASSTSSNLLSFRDAVSKYKLENEKESAYLSAITEIEPIQTEDKLMDKDMLESGTVRAFLYYPDVLSIDECQTLTEKIPDSDKEFFVTQSGSKVVYGSFSSGFLNSISRPDPRIPIQKIERSITFLFPQSVSSTHKFDDIQVSEPILDAKVCVLDSGIEPHDMYRSLMIGMEDFIQDENDEDRAHGTFVATRAIFGNDIEEQVRADGMLIAKAKILDLKVLRKNGGAADKDIIEALKLVLDNKKYAGIKVFNLSLNYDDVSGIHAQKKRFFTRELDSLAHDYKVIFVVSAGNQSVFYSTKKYPNCLFEHESVITSPADGINCISVGSIADASSTRAMALDNEPSPFTRTGLTGQRKPDVVHFGGNVDSYASHAGIGVKAFSSNQDEICEDAGTSFAAPLVSQVTAQVYEYLLSTKQWNMPPIDLTKALVIHSADYSLPLSSKINERDVDRVAGHGIPDFSRALDCSQSAATFIHCSSIGESKKKEDSVVKNTKHKIKFVVPPELKGKKKRVKVKGTLVYTPQVSTSGEIDYSLVDIDVNLHHINSNGKMQSGGLSTSERDYRPKWNPIKSFEKIYSAYTDGDWEIWLTMTTRGILDGKDHIQDYALVVTIEDVSDDPKNRVSLHEIVRTNHQEYNIVEVKTRARAQA